MKKIIFIALLLVACNNIEGRRPWPDGKIPFILSGFTAEEEVEIVKAMITWECASDGKIEFFIYGTKETDTKPLFIKWNMDNEVTTGAGYADNGYNLLGLSSISQYCILHELGHVLGLQHEMTRPDRDLYITINSHVIGNDLLLASQYAYVIPEFYDYKKYPFDYKSIMMYTVAYGAGIIDNHGHDLGGISLSVIDAWKVKDIYSKQDDGVLSNL